MIPGYLHRLFSLHVASELLLPELPLIESEQPEVLFRRASVAQAAPQQYKPQGPFHAVAPGGLWLHVPGVARFLVLGGREVCFDPLPGVDEDSLRVFLLGPCLGALLMQRGLLVLRGCAVRIGNVCAVLLGEPASGKSMLAAKLALRGYAVFGDDLVALDGDNRVLPGLPFIKLWSDVAGKLGIDVSRLQRTRPCLEKYYWPLEDSFHDAPLPVNRVYVLRTTGKEGLYLENIRGMSRFACLHEFGYWNRCPETAGPNASLLRQCAGLAGRVDMKFLYRRKFLPNVDEVADLILSDAGDQA